MVARASGFDGRVQGEEVGLFGNRANHRQHPADGAGFVRQALDGLGIDFDLADQRLQTLETLTDDLLTVADRLFGGATGFGGFLRAVGDLLDGVLQRAQGVTDFAGFAGLVQCAIVQGGAHLRQVVAAAGHGLGVLAQGAHQLPQIAAQAVQRSFDGFHLADFRVQFHDFIEVSLCPAGQGWNQLAQGAGQTALQSVNGQCDQQDQRDDPTLRQTHLGLDACTFRTNFGLQFRQRLLQCRNSGHAPVDQFAALADQLTRAFELGRIALEQAGELPFERNTGIFAGLLLAVGVQLQQVGEGGHAGLRLACDTEQRQGLQLGSLLIEHL